jgi:hypothetical protein
MTIRIGTNNTIITIIIKVMITLKALSNPMIAPHHVPTLASQNHISFARNQVIVPRTIALRNK